MVHPAHYSSIPDTLPDLRNLGVLARILIGVNGAAFFAATVGADGFGQLVDRMLHIALTLEPVLIGALVVLWLMNPILLRLPYLRGLGLIAVIVMLITAATQRFVAGVDASPQGLVPGAA